MLRIMYPKNTKERTCKGTYCKTVKRYICILICLALNTAALCGCVSAATTANSVFAEEAAEALAYQDESLFELEMTEDYSTPYPTVTPQLMSLTSAMQTADLPESASSSEPGETAMPGDPAALEVSDEPSKTEEPGESETPKVTEAPKATEKPEKTEEPEKEYTVKDIDDERGYVYAKSINLREGPGRDYDIIKEYEQYDTLTVTGKSGDWYQVKIGSRTGFMLKEYVKLGEVPKETPKPTPKPTPEPTAEPVPEVTSEPERTQAPSISTGSSSHLSDELYLLAQIVYKEGDGPSYAAVAGVIQNRINSSKFPNSVSGVIYQKSQFSTGSLKVPSSAAISAVESVFVNGNNPLPPNVYYFRTASSWSGHELYGKIGGNYFYY